MFKRNISMAIVATSLAISPITPAFASSGDVAAGVLLGVLGSAVVRDAKRHRTRKVYVPSVARAHNREIQTSLNYFGFPAGTPDGVMGRNSRNAVARYQAFLGYPATGRLTPYEDNFLVTSYQRAMAGGYATTQAIAQNPMGARGLLKQYQQEQATAVAPTAAPATPAAPATVPAATPAPNGALPSFMGQGQVQSASLASHCTKVSLMTNTNGGFVTQASMQDPKFALDEQFCLARTYAIAQGEDLEAKVQGFTPQQIAQQCKSLAPALKSEIAALSLKPEQAVLQDVSNFVLNSGASPAQLSGTAKICLSVGYRTDDMDMALASALLLTALGQPVYAELLGHHLSQGFGTSQRPDLSLAWYQTSFDALDKGAQPVFAPGQPEREALIRKAAYQLGGKTGGAAAQPPATTPQPAALPAFPIQE